MCLLAFLLHLALRGRELGEVSTGHQLLGKGLGLSVIESG
jgi:hypothetical protein